MDPTFGYDDLFAYRVMLQDEFENESDIIRELRYELLQRGMPQADIPNFLRNFYQTFEINISLNTINETLDTEQAHQMPFQNGNEFMNLLTGFLNQNFMPPNNVGDTSNNNIPNTNTDTSNNNNDASDNEVNVVVEEDNDEDLLEDNDENLENVDQDLVDDDNDLPPLVNAEGLMSSVVLTLSANGVQTSLPPIPINANHTPQQLENLLNALINQQGVSSLSSMFASQLPHPSVFNNIFNPVIAPMNNLQDVAVTLDQEALKNLKKYKSDKILEENCSVCMSKMGENPEEELCQLPCEHDFHSECIEPYLENYNYKCPICRKEVGKPKYDI